MTQKALHLSDEQLLLYADGELPSRDAKQVRAHLAVCPECKARAAEMGSAILDFTHAHRDSSKPSIDASGPRALLRARLAELVRNSHTGSRMHLRYARGLAYACALALLVATGVAVVRHQPATRLSGYSRLLPDPSFTPGATRQVALTDICSTDSDEVMQSVPSSVQQKIFHEYGITGVPAAEFEVDYLITPGLGGSDDVRNLWPEPHSHTLWNSYVKDQLEDHLHRMVCERKISLSEAQREIASDWIAAYKKYFHTEEPLANASPADTAETSSEETRIRSLLSIETL